MISSITLVVAFVLIVMVNTSIIALRRLAAVPSSGVAPLQNVILFDGVCNFCNAWVDLVLKVDSKQVFKFAALQSPRGKEILKSIGKDENDISTVVLVKSVDEVYFKSDVLVHVCRGLGGGFTYAGSALNLFPSIFRDEVYRVVAANRYNILGKREDCRCGEAGSRFEQ
jgi:predicted DCC family thiol-disulfide oxidoreductase YuxK